MMNLAYITISGVWLSLRSSILSFIIELRTVARWLEQMEKLLGVGDNMLE